MAKAKTASQMAIEALERISEHEKECGRRWAECTNEIKNLSVIQQRHAQRWEKLAWLVIATVLTTAASAWAAMIF